MPRIRPRKARARAGRMPLPECVLRARPSLKSHFLSRKLASLCCATRPTAARSMVVGSARAKRGPGMVQVMHSTPKHIFQCAQAAESKQSSIKHVYSSRIMMDSNQRPIQQVPKTPKVLRFLDPYKGAWHELAPYTSRSKKRRLTEVQTPTTKQFQPQTDPILVTHSPSKTSPILPVAVRIQGPPPPALAVISQHIRRGIRPRHPLSPGIQRRKKRGKSAFRKAKRVVQYRRLLIASDGPPPRDYDCSLISPLLTTTKAPGKQRDTREQHAAEALVILSQG